MVLLYVAPLISFRSIEKVGEMIQVEFLHDYANNQVQYSKGQQTELTEEQIAFLERDSPGCLKRVGATAEMGRRVLQAASRWVCSEQRFDSLLWAW